MLLIYPIIHFILNQHTYWHVYQLHLRHCILNKNKVTLFYAFFYSCINKALKCLLDY